MNCYPKVKIAFPQTGSSYNSHLTHLYPQLLLQNKQQEGRGHTQYPVQPWPITQPPAQGSQVALVRQQEAFLAESKISLNWYNLREI